MDFICPSKLKDFLKDGKICNKDRREEYQESLSYAEQLAKHMLGCTFIVRGNGFIISMVELYYGSAGDTGHDWYRNHYIYKNSKYKIRSDMQLEEGILGYLSLDDINDRYNRMDFVIGPKNVAISLLIRNVIDSSGKIVGKPQGSPNLVLKKMLIRTEDHGEKIEIINDLSDINPSKLYLYDTRDKILRLNNLDENKDIKSKYRRNLSSTFEKENNCMWNFSFQGNKFNCP